MSSFGYVALSFDERPGAEVLFGGDPAGYTLHSVRRDGELLDCSDPEALMDYLSALPLAHLTGDYDYEDQDQATYVLYFDAPKEVTRNLCVVLSGRQCKMDPSNGRAFQPYYLPEGVDIEQLDSLLTS